MQNPQSNQRRMKILTVHAKRLGHKPNLPVPMSCTERDRLEKEHAEAAARFDSANEQLRARIGICPKHEFVSLGRALDESWHALTRARTGLDRHIREHRCERAH